MTRGNALTVCIIIAAMAVAACSRAGHGVRDNGNGTHTDTAPEASDDGGSDTQAATQPAPVSLRVATFNVSLYRDNAGELIDDLREDDSDQIRVVAAIIQKVRPDVLLLNEFDYDAEGEALRLFAELLEVPTSGNEGIEYPHRWAAPSNTGRSTGFDLNNDGQVGVTPGTRAYGDDSAGYGVFEGQYAFAVLSKYPIDTDRIRSFRHLLWADLPDALLPDDLESAAPDDWYSAEELAIMPLSSKNHADIPITVGGHTLHLLASHPTPAGFDGPEDRNGRRNHDEIRLWAEYISADNVDGWLRDDRGHAGGLADGAFFVIAGDLNDDPFDGGSAGVGVRQLTEHALIHRSPIPSSEGAVEQAGAQAGVNATHTGPPAHDTGDFRDDMFGNQRVDYVLASATTRVDGAGVFWPRSDDPDFDLVGTYPFPGSDHRLVWLDLTLGSEGDEVND